MTRHVVAIAVDKVQTFLFASLQARTRDMETNRGTLSSVIGASRQISTYFYQDVGIEVKDGAFLVHKDDVILQCSGVCMFSTSLEKEEIAEKLDALFALYYRKFAGQLLIKYVYIEKDVTTGSDKLEAIKQCKTLLTKKDCLNAIIRDHQDKLFAFSDVEELDYSNEDISKYPEFVRKLDELRDETVSENNTCFRTAVIKADLDGMGRIFKEIKDFDTYDAVSKILSRHICMKSLEKHTKTIQAKYSDFKLFPLYIAGDDIFFMVSISQLTNGVKICENILQSINEEIKAIGNKEKRNTELKPLSLSIGIEFTLNREPIRYYYERVQKQLDLAKAADVLDIQEGYSKLCVNNYVFYDYEYGLTKELNDKDAQQPYWPHFLHIIKLLKTAIDKGFTAHHFFYGLLNKLTDNEIRKNDICYSNAVLYHLLPQYLESANKELCEAELLLIKQLLKQVTVKEERHKPFSKNHTIQSELSFGIDQRKRLEAYVRLLLMFSDERFKIAGQESDAKVNEFDADTIKNVRTGIFNRALRYLYEKSLLSSLLNRHDKVHKTQYKNRVKAMRDIFAKSERYQPDQKNMGKKNIKAEVYRTLRISASLFHRLKYVQVNNVEWSERIKRIERIAKMLMAVNDRTKEDIEKLEQEREAEHKAPPCLFFNHKFFMENVDSSGVWSNDYIDSLLIFYRYNEQSIRYRSIYGKKR